MSGSSNIRSVHHDNNIGTASSIRPLVGSNKWKPWLLFSFFVSLWLFSCFRPTILTIKFVTIKYWWAYSLCLKWTKPVYTLVTAVARVVTRPRFGVDRAYIGLRISYSRHLKCVKHKWTHSLTSITDNYRLIDVSWKPIRSHDFATRCAHWLRMLN